MNPSPRRLLPLLLILTIALAPVVSATVPAKSAAEIEQICGDLLGHTMGGRERSWKFQSRTQIKELVVKRASEDAQRRVYEVALKLQAVPGAPLYLAEARLDYRRRGGGWSLAEVGLLTLTRPGPAQPPRKP